jgi:hypothetical protein
MNKKYVHAGNKDRKGEGAMSVCSLFVVDRRSRCYNRSI